MTDQPTPQQAERPPQRTKKRPSARRSGQLSSLQVMFATVLAIGLILAINFSTRIASSRVQRDIYTNVENEVEQLLIERATLVAERDYVQSDAFVDQWARGEGKMVRAGEVLVVPVAPIGERPQITPTPQLFTTIQTSPPEPDIWTLWWALFFDEPPPGR